MTYTDTSVDPVPSVVEYLTDALETVAVYGERFPDGCAFPAVEVKYRGATNEYIRVAVTVRVPKGDTDAADAMALYGEVERALNFCAPGLCGINNGFCRREASRQFRHPTTDEAMVTADYLLEMGG